VGFSGWRSDRYGAPPLEYRVANWPATPVGKRWREVTQDRDAPQQWTGREPLYHWEAKVDAAVGGLADSQCEREPHASDEDIAQALAVSARTVCRVRKRLVTEGFLAAVDHQAVLLGYGWRLSQEIRHLHTDSGIMSEGSSKRGKRSEVV
jgi:hypothetical protein